MRQYQGHGRHVQGKKTGVDRWRRPCAAHLTPLAHRWRPTLLSTLPQGSDRRASRLGVIEISAPRCHVSARATWAFYTSTESDPGRGTRLAPSRPPRAATGRGRARDFFSEYARNPFRTRRSPSGRLPYGHATPRSRRWLLRCRRAVPSRPARTGWTLLRVSTRSARQQLPSTWYPAFRVDTSAAPAHHCIHLAVGASSRMGA